jgi:hypothetical protein
MYDEKTWEFVARNWIGAKTSGLLLVKARNPKGRWKKPADLPKAVGDYLCLEKNGARWCMTPFKTIEALEKGPESDNLALRRIDPVTIKGTATVDAYHPSDTRTMSWVEPPPPVELEYRGLDGSKWGLSDWYEDGLEKEIRKALSKGPKFRWTTGWYGSKKEIASACITCTGDGDLFVEASCSDDFDTEGHGDRTIPFTKNLDTIRKAVNAAWNEAGENKRDNEVFFGYSIGPRTGPRHRGSRMKSWKYTFIKDVSGFGLEQPPGDNYHQWGWQEDEDELDIPAADRKRLEKGMDACKPVIYAGDWMAESWDHAEERRNH